MHPPHQPNHDGQRGRPAGLVAAVIAAAALIGGAIAVPATAAGDASPSSTYRQERARCLSGQSGQELTTCLKEAGAARDAVGHDRLARPDADYKRNAASRCAALSGGDKQDCLERAKGGGTVSGSVKGGGMVRESVTVMPADGASAAAPR